MCDVVTFYSYDAHVLFIAYVTVVVKLVQKEGCSIFFYFSKQNKCCVIYVAILNYVCLEVKMNLCLCGISTSG